MAHHRSDVLAHAVALLDTHGLAALTMRRLGAELERAAERDLPPLRQQAGAARRGRRRDPGPRRPTARRRPSGPTGCARSAPSCAHAMLACTDGADVVATVWAFGLGAAAPVAELEKVLADADVPDELVAVASRTLVHYVFGHAFEEQTARQAVQPRRRRALAGVAARLRPRARPGDRRPAGPPGLRPPEAQALEVSDVRARRELGEVSTAAGEVDAVRSRLQHRRPPGRRRRGSRRAGRCGRGRSAAAAARSRRARASDGEGEVGHREVGLAQVDAGEVEPRQVGAADRHAEPRAADHGQRSQHALGEDAADQLAAVERGVEERRTPEVAAPRTPSRCGSRR